MWYGDVNHRLAIKIESEQKQLPEDVSNVIVIQNHNFFHIYRKYISRQITILEKNGIPSKYKHIAFCILIDGYGSLGTDQKTIQGNHIYSIKFSEDYANEVLILGNVASDLSHDLKTKIIDSFIHAKPLLQ
jgi:hypothetical protein